MSKRKICVVMGSRANYTSIKSAMRAILEHPDLELQLVVSASALLDRYGAVVDVIRADGFTPVANVFMLVEGETPATMAKSTGIGLIELPTLFEKLEPDVVLTVGDRFETMATTLAASYMNIPLAHTMGGEISGNIDETIRHAVTKFANIHFPACEDARDRIIRMGERQDCVHMVGCPRMDLVADLMKQNRPLAPTVFGEGVGPSFDLEQDFLIVSQHPVTTEYGEGQSQITETLNAVLDTGLPSLVLWPNADAGAEDVARGVRKFRERHGAAPFHYVKNLPPEIYLPLLAKTRCIVGNSSSAIREGAFIGSSAVDIGTRQNGRQRGRNVVNCGYHRDAILDAIQDRLATRRFPSEPIYGDGHAGPRIAEILSNCDLETRKIMTY